MDDAVRVTWLGHATVLVETGGVRVLTDPVLRNHVGPLRRIGPGPDPALWQGIDAVVISHLHHDHLDRASLRRIDPRVPVLVPAGAGGLLPDHLDVREVVSGATQVIGGVPVQAVRAHHGDDRIGTGLHCAPLGYLIGRTWFAGDTGLHDGLDALSGRVDTALVPAGGWGLTLGPHHLDPDQAAQAVARVGARDAVPIHWGTLFVAGAWHLRPSRSREPGRLFVEALARRAPAATARVHPPGVPITIG